jgi:hypothetical protein
MSGKAIRLTTRDKLLIIQYRENNPKLSLEFISDLFNVHLGQIKKLFNGSDLIIPSKMNRQHG